MSKARTNNIIKRIVDAAMTVLLLFLMAYQVTGEMAHEWIGMGMTVLVIIHQILNRKWYGALFKGKYNPYRTVTTILNILLLLGIALTAFCGMSMSGYAVPFLYGMAPVSFVRRMHLSMSHWGFVLMGLHLGMHIPAMTAGLKLKDRTKKILTCIFAGIGGIGLNLFLQSGMPDYLFFRVPFAFLDYEKAGWQVLLENMLMLSFWAFVGTQTAAVCRKAVQKAETKKNPILPVAAVMASVIIGIVLTFLFPSADGQTSFGNADWSAPQAEGTQKEAAGGVQEGTQTEGAGREQDASQTENASAGTNTAAAGAVSSDTAAGADSSVVFFTSDISAEGLVKIYDTLGWTPAGNAAVKISTGEPPASNYLRPELIGDLVKKVDGTIVECNTAYGGSRSSSAMHRQVAEDHGYTAIADFDLMDEEGEVEWPMSGGTRIDKVIVGSHAENYSDWVILSHFKGHAMAGFGGAIKNVGIGISSPSGKVYIHTAGTKTSGSIWYSDQDAWLEALAEMVSGFSSHVGKEHIIYINVMNRLSVDCDCDGHPAEPDIHDIGILASSDPVALDQACVDLIYQAEGNESLVERMESLHAVHTLEHAEEIGLGSRSYELVNIDC